MKAGDTIGGRYKLIQRLGAGGMGVVWEAVNERTGRKVALKLILHPTEDLRQRLRREARVCGSLNHPNIVEVYDVGDTEEGEPFLVMQLFTGETLGQMLESKRRIEPPVLAARIGRDIATALDAAHNAKVIHRDLKPANIFLQREPGALETAFTVKVLDFGVSKVLSTDDGPATVTGLVVGSPAYMSPEQVRMEKGLDYRTDIWSLGIILYEMLTGNRPFVGKTVEDVVHQILTSPIQPPSSRVRNVPPELDQIVVQCLERDRSKRMQDAKSVARTLGIIAEVSQVSRVVVNVLSAPTSIAGPPSSGPMPVAGPPIAGRPSMVNAPMEVSPASTAARSETTSSSSRILLSSSDLETVSLQRAEGPFNVGQAPSSPEGASGAASATAPLPVATQVLSPSDPIMSPMPAWRIEMQQALAANRQAASAPTVPPDPLQQGGTLAIPAEVMLGSVATPPPEAGVTTTTVPTVQASSGAGTITGPVSDATSRKRKQGMGIGLYVGIGIGIVSLAALALVVVLSSHTSESASKQAASSAAAAPTSAPAPSTTSAAVALLAAPTTADSASARASTSASPAAVAPPTAIATATAVPATSAQKSGTVPPRRRCTRFITTNCVKQ